MHRLQTIILATPLLVLFTTPVTPQEKPVSFRYAPTAAGQTMRTAQKVRISLTDGTIRHLIGLNQLERLYFDWTAVGDGSLPHLKRFENVRVLNLQMSRISDNAIKRLRVSLPNCEILE